jgi:exonuclease SbcC
MIEHEQKDLRDQLEKRVPTVERLAVIQEAIADLALRLEQAVVRQNRLSAEEQAFKDAKEQIKALESRKHEAIAEQGRLQAELTRHQATMAEARAEADRKDALEAAYTEWEQANAEDQAFRKLSDAFHALDKELSAVQRSLSEAGHRHQLSRRALESELSTLEKERASHQDLVGDRERIESAHAQLVAARASESTHMENAQAARRLEERLAAIETQMARLRMKHEGERQEKLMRLARAQEEAQDLDAIREEMTAVQARIDELARMAVEQDRVKEKGIMFRAAKEQAEAAAETARQTARTKETKLAQLESGLAVHAGARSGARDNAAHSCPLCETPLSETDLGKIITSYREEIQGLLDEESRLLDEAAKHENDRLAARGKYAELAEQLKSREREQQRLGELTNRLRTLEGALGEAARIEKELAASVEPELPEALVAERDAVLREKAALNYDPAELSVLQAKISDFRWAEARHWQLEQATAALAKIETRAPALKAELEAADAAWQAEREALELQKADIETRTRALGYDRPAHEALKARLETLVDAPRAWNDLQKHLLWLEGASAQVARLEAEKAQQALKVAEADTELERLARQLTRLPLWEGEVEAVQAELRHLRIEERQRLEERGRLEAELTMLDEVEAKLKVRQGEWESLISDSQTYKELSSAFGRDGIQAVIIENAIPEIEEEANRLLSRMTDNRMHVRLATQKEKKTGGINETLEIYISDEVGTRSYELFSGGEAFRVNFALRLSLSRLLARRAGARLQTLVIDEGFGTQDDKGRERLVEAINAVSPEFARILVITHIKELKEAFNTQIEIVKRGGLSEVRLHV